MRMRVGEVVVPRDRRISVDGGRGRAGGRAEAGGSSVWRVMQEVVVRQRKL